MPVKVALKIEDGEAISIVYRLRNRLGFQNVRGVEKATVWKLYLKGENPESAAKEIAEGLLIIPIRIAMRSWGKSHRLGW